MPGAMGRGISEEFQDVRAPPGLLLDESKSLAPPGS